MISLFSVLEEKISNCRNSDNHKEVNDALKSFLELKNRIKSSSLYDSGNKIDGYSSGYNRAIKNILDLKQEKGNHNVF